MNNETKIGLLTVVAFAAAFWGFNYLKGINLLTTSQIFYVKYPNVDQLLPSSPVKINGLQVGMVKSLYVDQADGRTIIAVLNIDQEVGLPKNTKAVISGFGALGSGRYVELVYSGPCISGDCAKSGDYLQGSNQTIVESMLGDPKALDLYLQKLQAGLVSIYDSIADPNDPQGLGRSLVALEESFRNIAALTQKVNRLLDASTAGFVATANNTADITKAIRESNQNISSALANLNDVSLQLKNAGVGVTVSKAGIALDSMTASVAALRMTLNAASSTMSKVDTIAQNLAQGEGLAGRLLTDKELADNLTRTTRHLHLLMQDLRINPKRYNTVKLKIFGKNKTPNYINPVDDPAYRRLVDSLEQDYSKKVKQ